MLRRVAPELVEQSSVAGLRLKSSLTGPNGDRSVDLFKSHTLNVSGSLLIGCIRGFLVPRELGHSSEQLQQQLLSEH